MKKCPLCKSEMMYKQFLIKSNTTGTATMNASASAYTVLSSSASDFHHSGAGLNKERLIKHWQCTNPECQAIDESL